jgi:Dolichyl-phosphate-mannose-protein mannosyltransferase
MFMHLRSALRSPLVLLAIVSVLSLAARAAWLGEPCQSPCNKAGDHVLVFDEAYYVNAARVIAGLTPPTGAHYADAPSGTDPNAEHPQGAKLIMAASIDLFGDGPLAWRLGSLVFGSLAILGIYALVRAAGGGPWLALGAGTLMACDNLLLVHGRIGTLDIYVLAPMVWGVALYLRGRPILAGVLIAVAACFKEIAPYALLVLALVEGLRLAAARGDPAVAVAGGAKRALGRLGMCGLTAAALFVALLGLMDRIATPYADSSATLITGGPFAHIAHMISYAADLTSPKGPTGIASYPWQWLFDYKPITYLRINPSDPTNEFHAIHPVSAFFGMMSPPIMVLAIPSLLFAAYRIALLVARPTASVDGPPVPTQLGIVGLAWFLGTFLPFELQSLIFSRTSYIYYMVVVMPGIYVSIVYLLAYARRPRLTAVWALAVLAAVVLMYPFVPVF